MQNDCIISSFICFPFKTTINNELIINKKAMELQKLLNWEVVEEPVFYLNGDLIEEKMGMVKWLMKKPYCISNKN